MYRACTDCRHVIPREPGDRGKSQCSYVAMFSGDTIVYDTVEWARGPRGTCGPDGLRFEHKDAPRDDFPAFAIAMAVLALVGIGAIVAIALTVPR